MQSLKPIIDPNLYCQTDRIKLGNTNLALTIILIKQTHTYPLVSGNSHSINTQPPILCKNI